jgi:hypothetical protein
MDIPIQVEGFENRNLVLKTPTVWRGAQLWIDGGKAPKGPKRGRFLLKRNDGREVMARFRNVFVDPMPDVEIDGQLIKTVEPLAWYQMIWCYWPILLITLGGALGGFIGACAIMLNARLFREDLHPAFKYFVTGMVSVFSFVLVFLLVAWLQWSLKR